MLENIHCNLCNHYYRNSKVIRKEERISGKKKKNIIYTRKCHSGHKTVTADDVACKYFSPVETFYCDLNHCILNVVNCLNRRRNPKNLSPWDNCKKCRQYSKGISDLLNDYYLNETPILQPKRIRRRDKKEDNPKPRKIKRREKYITVKPKRIIERREKPKRVIKRRDTSEIRDKIKRRIKRRKPKKIKRRIK